VLNIIKSYQTLTRFHFGWEVLVMPLKLLVV